MRIMTSTPILKIPTPLDVAGLRSARLAPIVNEQVRLVTHAMSQGEETCPAIDGYSAIADELRARMHEAGWALGTTNGRNETILTWSPLPASDDRRVAAEADGVLALAHQLRGAYEANDKDWRAVARAAVDLLTSRDRKSVV